jgi:tRNA (cytidine32/uridine32-2'-O)-methyltransferase
VHLPIRIVLVETSHPGNIGAAARAMKTMGLHDLVLVAPRSFPDPEATARASGADDVLAAARVVPDLPGAIAECSLVVGASARLRGGRWPVTDPRQCAAEVIRRTPAERCAIVMGPEQSGLTNEDLARCQALVHIPTAPDYGSLNLAMAVQVVCYELRMAALAAAAAAATARSGTAAPAPAPLAPGIEPEARDAPPATAAEIEGLHAHLEDVLTRSGFLHPAHPKQLRLKLRRLFMRADLDQNEVNILRGALASLDPARGEPGE